MTIWNGPYPDRPEEEREAEWHDSGDEDAPQEWRGEEHPMDADYWHEDWPGEQMAGPEYWLYLGDAQREGDDEGEG